MSEVSGAADEAVYTNETGEAFSLADASDAGWRIVHEGVDPNAEDATANATYHRAEKYHSPPGRAGGFIEEFGATVEKLLERIYARERNLGSVATEDASATVTLAADGVAAEDVNLSDPETIQQVPDSAITAARDNDVLTVLSDPEDPDSEVVRKTVFGGQEVDESVLSEPTAPSTQAEADTREAHQAAIDQAIEARDNADKPSDANSPDASLAALGAETDARQAQHDNANAETTQPEAGTATDASDSEQQSQVPDSEAASSDAGTTNDTDAFPKTNESQPEEIGPDTDTLAPAPAPNAGQDSTDRFDDAA